jgi:predicted enzyme related to lactoylglutathione lyase
MQNADSSPFQVVTGPRQLHEFCWINMLTRDMDAEQAFFAAVFDWTYGDIPGMGFTIKAQGSDVGGLFDLDHPNTPKGLPAHIGTSTALDPTRAATLYNIPVLCVCA